MVFTKPTWETLTFKGVVWQVGTNTSGTRMGGAGVVRKELASLSCVSGHTSAVVIADRVGASTVVHAGRTASCARAVVCYLIAICACESGEAVAFKSILLL